MGGMSGLMGGMMMSSSSRILFSLMGSSIPVAMGDERLQKISAAATNKMIEMCLMEVFIPVSPFWCKTTVIILMFTVLYTLKPS